MACHNEIHMHIYIFKSCAFTAGMWCFHSFRPSWEREMGRCQQDIERVPSDWWYQSRSWEEVPQDRVMCRHSDRCSQRCHHSESRTRRCHWSGSGKSPILDGSLRAERWASIYWQGSSNRAHGAGKRDCSAWIFPVQGTECTWFGCPLRWVGPITTNSMHTWYSNINMT